jgi:hypothetical protein
METYDFVFTLSGFSQSGEEFRLRTHVYSVTGKGGGLPSAVVNLKNFVVRILRIEEDHLAVKKIMLKSVWLSTSSKHAQRVTTRQVMEAMLAKGFLTPKGREDERIKGKPPRQGEAFGRRPSEPPGRPGQKKSILDYRKPKPKP